MNPDHHADDDYDPVCQIFDLVQANGAPPLTIIRFREHCLPAAETGRPSPNPSLPP
jgi:hypothetical protein